MNEHAFDKEERDGLFDVNCHWWSGNELVEHSHSDYYEILIITDGQVSTKINNDFFSCKKGTAIFLRPNTFHCIEKGEKTSHYNIAVREEYFNALFSSNEYLFNALSEGYIVFNLPVLSFNYLLSLISKINNEEFTTLSHTLIDNVLNTLACHVMLEKDSNGQTNDKIQSYCNHAITKIDGGAYLNKKVNEIIATYPVSQPTFISRFKKITGKTPSQYLNYKRLQKAKNLLSTTSLSILEISLKIGYDSLSHFIKLFKSCFSCTPLEYRNKSKKKGKVYTYDS